MPASENHGYFEESDWSRVDAMLDVNIKALTRLTHAILTDLVRVGRGAILNVSSIASLLPLPKMAVYAASKAYVTSFSEALRGELRDTGVSGHRALPRPREHRVFPDRRTQRRVATPCPLPRFSKFPAEEVVHAGLFAVERDRARVIPGWLCAWS